MRPTDSSSRLEAMADVAIKLAAGQGIAILKNAKHGEIVLTSKELARAVKISTEVKGLVVKALRTQGRKAQGESESNDI